MDGETTTILRQQDEDLRARCARLLGDEAPTRSEWLDADLGQMDGHSASDAELIAYWRAFRATADLTDEPIELCEVTDLLEAGEDPAAALVARFEALG